MHFFISTDLHLNFCRSKVVKINYELKTSATYWSRDLYFFLSLLSSSASCPLVIVKQDKKEKLGGDWYISPTGFSYLNPFIIWNGRRATTYVLCMVARESLSGTFALRVFPACLILLGLMCSNSF